MAHTRTRTQIVIGAGVGTHSEHRFPAPFSLKEGCRKPVLEFGVGIVWA